MNDYPLKQLAAGKICPIENILSLGLECQGQDGEVRSPETPCQAGAVTEEAAQVGELRHFLGLLLFRQAEVQGPVHLLE